MNKESKIYIAGHRGMVGSAIMRNLIEKGYLNIVTRSSQELDLRNQEKVNSFFKEEQPEYVFLAAAKVGGIIANNTYKADFITDNLSIELNILKASHDHKVNKLLFLGSSCIYPKLAPQPMKEEHLLTGLLEPTNEPYAIAKIAGIKMCEAYRDQYNDNFISVMPTNLFGIGDNYDLQNSHVLPAMIRKFHEAMLNNSPNVEIWGTGKPRREFLYADDLADACVYLMLNYNDKEFVNIGIGEDISIEELAEKVKSIIGYKGALEFNTSKPDGTPRKLLDVSKLNQLGWTAKTELDHGIELAYQDYLKTKQTI